MRALGLAVPIAAVVLIVSTGSARGACDFPHPVRAKGFRGSLVSAFNFCGQPYGPSSGQEPNTTTEGGVPACQPPETYRELGGSPPEGWIWQPGGGGGEIGVKAAKNKVLGLSNADPNDVADATITLKLRGVWDEQFGPASGTGSLAMVVRATMKDPVGGDMTAVDFPFGRPFELTAGKASFKTSFNAALLAINEPGLPGCTSLEVLYARVVDETGQDFASMGLFLPMN